MDLAAKKLVVSAELTLRPLECDFLVCLFVAAVKSYRMDHCVRPFPPFYMNAYNEKDFRRLRAVCDSIPPIDQLIDDSKYLTPDITNLLYWLLVLKPYPRSRFIKHELVLTTLSSQFTPQPAYVLEVDYSDEKLENWEVQRGCKDTFFAFHGSPVENFHSIVKFGLQPHMNPRGEALFGEGIYLSRDLTVCTNFAPFSATWDKSILGERYSIIAVCEVIHDQNKVMVEEGLETSRGLNRTSIPNTYVLVTDSDLVRVKYLLVYRQKTKATSFLRNLQGVVIVVLIYIAMLMLIKLYNGISTQPPKN